MSRRPEARRRRLRPAAGAVLRRAGGEPQPAQEPGLRRARPSAAAVSSTSCPSPGRRPRPTCSTASRSGGSASERPGRPVARAIDEARAAARRATHPSSAAGAPARRTRRSRPLPDDRGWRSRCARREGSWPRARACSSRRDAPRADGSCRAGRWTLYRRWSLNRSPAAIRLVSVTLPGGEAAAVGTPTLAGNEKQALKREVAVPDGGPISTPYWLREPATAGLYVVAGPRARRRARGPSPRSSVTFVYEAGGRALPRRRGRWSYAWTDPVRGELCAAFEIAPPVTVDARRARPRCSPTARPSPCRCCACAPGATASRGKVRLEVPAGWRAEPAEVPVHARQRAETSARCASRVHCRPRGRGQRRRLRVAVESRRPHESWRVRGTSSTIRTSRCRPCASRPRCALVPLSAAGHEGERIGYIPGSGRPRGREPRRRRATR